MYQERSERVAPLCGRKAHRTYPSTRCISFTCAGEHPVSTHKAVKCSKVLEVLVKDLSTVEISLPSHVILWEGTRLDFGETSSPACTSPWCTA